MNGEAKHVHHRTNDDRAVGPTNETRAGAEGRNARLPWLRHARVGVGGQQHARETERRSRRNARQTTTAAQQR
eukprot:4544820-Prymnesium_polylepis.1